MLPAPGDSPSAPGGGTCVVGCQFIPYRERGEEESSCAAFALAGGLAPIIAGSVIMSMTTDTQTHLVEEYNR